MFPSHLVLVFRSKAIAGPSPGPVGLLLAVAVPPSETSFKLEVPGAMLGSRIVSVSVCVLALYDRLAWNVCLGVAWAPPLKSMPVPARSLKTSPGWRPELTGGSPLTYRPVELWLPEGL
jgi:hypothetical protein